MMEDQEQQIRKVVSRKDHDKLKLLLSNANSNETYKFKSMLKSALDLAALNGDEVSVELLLAHGAIPDFDLTEKVWPRTILSYAIIKRNHKVIELLINHGCDPDDSLTERSRYTYNYWHRIIEEGDLSLFKLFLKCKNREISNNEWSQKMLFAACRSGSKSIVKYLLNRGVSIESVDENGYASLFCAVISSRESIFKLLVARGANLKHKDNKNRSLLHVVTLGGWKEWKRQKKIFKLLIDYSADINATDINGCTPLYAASSGPHVNRKQIMLKFLRQSGIDIMKPADNDGTTVLHRLVKVNLTKVIKHVLCQPEVDINVRDKNGRTPLQFGKIYRMENLTLLLEFGADTENFPDYEEGEGANKFLEKFQLKRIAAGFGKDRNIDTILAHQSNVLSKKKRSRLISKYTKEIQRMKETRLCGKLTFYDFLHAKKLTCIKVAEKPGMRKILLKSKHGFKRYANFLTKNYVLGTRPLPPIESEAVSNAEKNLNMIFHYKLPSLVVSNIKNCIDIEDMIKLENIRTLSSND